MSELSDREVGGALRELARKDKRKKRLSDEDANRLMDFLEKQSDAELVSWWLTIQRLLELHATGKARELADMGAIATFAMLGRFASRELEDGLALYHEHAEDYEEASDRA